jgi:4-hydroxybenzoyl-CoA reductase subunit alpha
MQSFSAINKYTPRIDAPGKVTGRAAFVDDLSLPGTLFGHLVQSPYPHARILNIDTSKAEKLPGVKAVVTAREAGMVKFGVSPARYDETVFCLDKALHVGDEIAAVAAVDEDIAQEAASLIKVDYEELPAVLTVEQAVQKGAPQLHADFPGNICAEVHQNFGDVEKGLAESDYVRTDSMKSKRQDGGFIEPQACLANYDLHNHLTLYSSTQVPHYVQRIIAMVLGLPIGRVRVVKPYVGAGFGIKASASPLELSACLLSMKTKKPVKMRYSREQVFMHGRARHQFTHKMTTGVKRDGTLMALKHECYLDGGAYSSFGIATVYYAGSMLGGPYKLPNMSYDGYRIYTNKPACGAQRGHGAVIARAAFEQQMDIIAEELGIDPVDLRLKNMMEAGDVSCNELSMSSLGMRECCEAVRDQSGWSDKKQEYDRAKKSSGGSHVQKGLGMACGFFVSGAGYPIYRSETPHGTIMMKTTEDGGHVLLYTASAEIGQGSDTTFATIAAEALGLKLEHIRLMSGDTDYGVDLGAYSSRQTLMTGHAVIEAAQDLKQKIIDVLAEELGISPSSIDIYDSKIVFSDPNVDFSHLRTKYIKEHVGWTDNPEGEELTFCEASRIAFLKRGILVGTGKYNPPKLGGSYKGAAVGTSPAYGCSAQITEVEVDSETGKIRVTNMTDAHDCGRAINRSSVEGQMQGSLSMGLGEALFEEVKFDDQGRVVNADLAEYKIPTALDMPPITPIIVESDEPNGPYGAKEVGEGAIMPTIPAVLNAVYNATGVRFWELPLTCDRVLKGIEEHKKSKSGAE